MEPSRADAASSGSDQGIDSHLDGSGTRRMRWRTMFWTAWARPFKELPPKRFYDARGAGAVRPRICELPEY